MNKEEEVSRKERERESHEINHGKGSYKTNNYGPIIWLGRVRFLLRQFSNEWKAEYNWCMINEPHSISSWQAINYYFSANLDLILGWYPTHRQCTCLDWAKIIKLEPYHLLFIISCVKSTFMSSFKRTFADEFNLASSSVTITHLLGGLVSWLIVMHNNFTDLNQRNEVKLFI